jgi:predicted component of type VI protein secretion system
MIPRRNTAAARLAALLDALEADLLTTSPEEVRAALQETGRTREGAIRELRSLLRDAEIQGDGRYPSALPADERDGIRTQLH